MHVGLSDDIPNRNVGLNIFYRVKLPDDLLISTTSDRHTIGVKCISWKFILGGICVWKCCPICGRNGNDGLHRKYGIHVGSWIYLGWLVFAHRSYSQNTKLVYHCSWYWKMYNIRSDNLFCFDTNRFKWQNWSYKTSSRATRTAFDVIFHVRNLCFQLFVSFVSPNRWCQWCDIGYPK